MEADNRSLMELPKANLEGVLTRLPVKSLLVCCCVSKSLLNLIENDSGFAKMHFAKSEAQLMIHSPENPSFHLIDLDVDTTPGRGARVEIKPNFNLPEHGFEVTHSCNGLVLLESMNRADRVHCCIVCNPVTGEYTMLPETVYHSTNVKCAFFYCPTTNQFKVLRTFHLVFRMENGPSPDSDASFDLDPDSYMELDLSSDSGSDSDFDSESATRFDLFSDSDSDLDSDTYSEDSDFSSDTDSDSVYSESDTMGQLLVGGCDSWETLGHLPFSPLTIYSPCYLGKATHWLCADENVPNLIVFFHFESHQFGEIPTPIHMGKAHTNAHDNMSLVVIGGFLSIFDSFTKKGKFDIWIMKEYGVRDSWTKDFVIDTTAWGVYNLDFCYKPAICRSNGELLMICEDGYLLFYDLLKKTGRIIKHQQLEHPFKAVVHTPSIMSLSDVMRESNIAVLNVASRFTRPELNPHYYLELSTTFSERQTANY